MTSDEAFLDLLAKAAGDDIEPWLMDVVKAQIRERGIDGLTPTAYAVVEDIVAKHGDPSRPGYGAMHPNGGAHIGAAAHENNAAKLKAGRSQLRGGDPVVHVGMQGRRNATYVQRNGNGTHTVREGSGATSKVQDKHIAPAHLAHLLPPYTGPSNLLGTIW